MLPSSRFSVGGFFKRKPHDRLWKHPRALWSLHTEDKDLNDDKFIAFVHDPPGFFAADVVDASDDAGVFHARFRVYLLDGDLRVVIEYRDKALDLCLRVADQAYARLDVLR